MTFRRILKSKSALAGFVIITLDLILAIFAPFIATHSYDEMDFMYVLAKPGE